MAYTQADIDSLKSAIAGGTTQVRYGDRQVSYRSVSEMRAILRMMQAEVDANSGKKQRSRFRRITDYCRH